MYLTLRLLSLGKKQQAWTRTLKAANSSEANKNGERSEDPDRIISSSFEQVAVAKKPDEIPVVLDMVICYQLNYLTI